MRNFTAVFLLKEVEERGRKGVGRRKVKGEDETWRNEEIKLVENILLNFKAIFLVQKGKKKEAEEMERKIGEEKYLKK